MAGNLVVTIVVVGLFDFYSQLIMNYVFKFEKGFFFIFLGKWNGMIG